MTKEETLALYALGKEAWNAWAEKRLSERAELEGVKEGIRDLNGNNNSPGIEEATRQWLVDARADFTAEGFGSDADFTEYLFPGEAVFNEATFYHSINFDKAIFKNTAQFRAVQFQGSMMSCRGATFEGTTNFYKAKFHQEASFADTTFNGDVSFERATFAEHADFVRAQFSDIATFHRSGFASVIFQSSSFTKKTKFSRTKFSEGVIFFDVVFESEVSFESAAFDNEALFNKTQFKGPASFALVIFRHFTHFTDSTFTAEASFVAMKGESCFEMRRTKFNVLPDFAQAHFDEAPRLDEPRFNRRPARSAEYPARWRTLKRLAIQGHDHEREQMFFAEEIKSLRGVEDFPLPRLNDGRLTWSGSGRYWVGVLYEGFSDFGRSILRPILWWWLIAVLAASFYLHYHLLSSNPATTLYHWALGTNKVSPLAKLACLNCPSHSADQDNPVTSAAYISIHNGVVFSGLGRSEKLIQSYRCLFGGTETTPNLPTVIVFVGLLQTLLSAVLIFLLGLAVRNKFRIK